MKDVLILHFALCPHLKCRWLTCSMVRGMSTGLKCIFRGRQATGLGDVNLLTAVFKLSSQSFAFGAEYVMFLLRFVEGTAAEKARKVINKMLDYR